MPYFLFFDTETTGLPKNYKASYKDVDNWPRIIQLAWLMTDETGEEIARSCQLVKPDGWVIPDGEFWVKNGFSTKDNELYGEPIKKLLVDFLIYKKECDYLVAHNMSYDMPIIMSELYRAQITGPHSEIKKICTKDSGTDYCKLPGSYGKYKWPKLEEVHQKLFGRGFEGAHDAMNDVIACKDCFFEMVKLGIIKLQ